MEESLTAESFENQEEVRHGRIRLWRRNRGGSGNGFFTTEPDERKEWIGKYSEWEINLSP